ncbi:hypothetical protein [Actinoplanes sp. NPDC049118]|uniref:hypothetical protein n=1 Tax=Actinoplanes sp. NPDC049118 TaxID=3155769 RepID=UPI003403D97B
MRLLSAGSAEDAEDACHRADPLATAEAIAAAVRAGRSAAIDAARVTTAQSDVRRRAATRWCSTALTAASAGFWSPSVVAPATAAC